MSDITMPDGGLPPDRPLAPAPLAEILRAHELAARVVEAAVALHVELPEACRARPRVPAFLTAAAAIESAVVADLRAALAADLSPGDAAAVVRHADRMHALRPRLGRFVDRLLLAEALRRAGLAA